MKTGSSLNLDADDTELMEIWHEQTKLYRASLGRRSRVMQTFFSDPNTVRSSSCGWQITAGEKRVALPEARRSCRHPLGEILAERKSAPRASLGGGFAIGELSDILDFAVRSNRKASPEVAPDAVFHFRPYPSAGGLYPCEVFVLPGSIDGLVRKPYRYDPREHVLVDFACQPGRFPGVEIETGFCPPAAVFVIVAVLDRSTRKYGPRGYRMACLEAGHVGQNLVLAATALDLKTLVYSSFCDDELERWLGLDGRNEVVLSTILVGSDPPRPT